MVPAEARTAFKKLAYSRFKGMPLYLEWAPSNVFRFASDGSKIKISNKVKVNDPEEEVNAKVQRPQPFELPNYDKNDDDEDEPDVPEPETTLFVKNLNFSTNEDELKKVKKTLEGH
jgi:multiple RNA-binding domain-containing protein 1